MERSSHDPPALTGMRLAIALPLVLLVYTALGELGLSLAVVSPQVSPFWPPTAAALAAVLLLGYRVWPAIAVGALVFNLHTHAPVGAAVSIAAGNTLEAMVGARLLRMARFRPGMDSVRDVLALAGLAAAASTAISATVGVASLWAAGSVPRELVPSAWWTWWLGDATGDLVFAPLFLTWGSRPPSRQAGRPSEAALMLAGVAALSTLIFVWPFGPKPHLNYLIGPLLVWSALRLGQAYTATGITFIAALAILGIHRSAWGLSREELNERILLLQTFLGVMSVSSLALGAVAAERRRIQDSLRHALAARTEAERLLAAKAADLERSNADLEDFAYVASHDLKEPLRGISSYSTMLLEDCAGKLDEGATSKLNTLRTLSARMDSLISALLEYSRLGRTGLAVAETDLGAVVENALRALAPRLEEERVEVATGPLPRVRCDPHRIQQVFANLVSNAVKYNDKPHKRVEIGSLTRGPGGEPGPVLFVRDNGIGIPDRHLHKLFRMFKRLHPRDAYGGGTGAGLAIVKSIVERHGGHVWCVSIPGEGSTFYFTLPPTSPAPVPAWGPAAANPARGPASPSGA